MKNTFSQSMAWLHTWSGLVFGWLLFAIFLTGSLSIFDREITRWMQPEISVTEVSAAEAANHAAEYLQRRAPESESWLVVPPNSRNTGMTVFWQDENREFQHALLNPATGQRAARQTDGGHFFVHFHYQLNAGTIGIFIVGIAGLMMFIGMLTGIVIHKRIFKDFFTFRPRSGAQRSWLDVHNALGVLTLPFLLVITFSGLAIFAFMYIPSPIQYLYGNGPEATEAFFHEARPHVELEPAGESASMLPLGHFVERAQAAFDGNQVWFLSVDHPGDRNAVVNVGALNETRLTLSNQQIFFNGVTGEILQEGISLKPAIHTQRVLSGLHFAQFGGYSMHWLYFLSGLAGTLMIAAGLILFTVKRRRKIAAENNVSDGFLRFAEKMNIAAIMGPVLGCIAYLWANRLIPVDLVERAQWETGIFYGVWLLSLGHALARPAGYGWIEQVGCASALCLLLPLLNFLTTSRHLLVTVPNGYWKLAVVELTIIVIGSLLACTALQLNRRHRSSEHALQSAGLWEFAD